MTGQGRPGKDAEKRKRPRGRYGEGGVWQLADGSWRGSVDLGHDPVTGKRARKMVRGRTRAEANRKVREYRDQAAGGSLTVDTRARARLTVGSWLREWLDGPCALKVQGDTWRRYDGIVRNHLVPHIGSVPLARLTPERVEKMYAEIKRSGGGADSSVRQVHRVLSRAFKVAHQRGHVPRNVLALVDTPPLRDQDEGEPLTLKEARRLLKGGMDSDRPARWVVALGLGARQAEVLGLCWDKVDLDAGTIVLDRQLKRRPYEHACPLDADRKGTCGSKTAKTCKVHVCPAGAAGDPTCGRTTCQARVDSAGLWLKGWTKQQKPTPLPLPGFVLRALKQRKAQQAEDRLAAGECWDPDWDAHGGLVFTNAVGKPLDLRQDHGAWKALLKRVKIDPRRLHDARHTTGTLLTDAGVDSRVIQAILGHSSAAITRRYQKVKVETARAGTDELDRLLGG